MLSPLIWWLTGCTVRGQGAKTAHVVSTVLQIETRRVLTAWHVFPQRTNRIPKDIHVEPERFAAELISRLEGVVREREAEEKLEERLKRVRLVCSLHFLNQFLLFKGTSMSTVWLIWFNTGISGISEELLQRFILESTVCTQSVL